jgi:hypothetical protein
LSLWGVEWISILSISGLLSSPAASFSLLAHRRITMDFQFVLEFPPKYNDVPKRNEKARDAINRAKTRQHAVYDKKMIESCVRSYYTDKESMLHQTKLEFRYLINLVHLFTAGEWISIQKFPSLVTEVFEVIADHRMCPDWTRIFSMISACEQLRHLTRQFFVGTHPHAPDCAAID